MSKVYINKNSIPLSFIQVHQGDWVVIKPNLVKESKETDASEWKSVITSEKLIRAVTEYVCAQLQGTGRITICDAPQTDSSFEKITSTLGLFKIAESMQQKYQIPIEVIDLRNEEWANEGGVNTQSKKLKGPQWCFCF